MDTCKRIKKIIGLLLFAAVIPARAVTITQSNSAGWIGIFGEFGGNGRTSDCDPINDGPRFAGFGACTGSMSLDGYYEIGGAGQSGILQFPFGSFFSPGIIGPNVNMSLWISGPGLIDVQGMELLNLGGVHSPMVTLELGEVYHIRYFASWFPSQDGGFSYSFSSPGVLVFPTSDPPPAPEPGSAWMALLAIGAWCATHRTTWSRR